MVCIVCCPLLLAELLQNIVGIEPARDQGHYRGDCCQGDAIIFGNYDCVVRFEDDEG